MGSVSGVGDGGRSSWNGGGIRGRAEEESEEEIEEDEEKGRGAVGFYEE